MGHDKCGSGVAGNHHQNGGMARDQLADTLRELEWSAPVRAEPRLGVELVLDVCVVVADAAHECDRRDQRPVAETADELLATLSDLRGAGCDIATVGQYLQPHERRLPVEKYYTPDEFDALRRGGEAMGFLRVESGPLVRSSYHAKRALDGARN